MVQESTAGLLIDRIREESGDSSFLCGKSITMECKAIPGSFEYSTEGLLVFQEMILSRKKVAEGKHLGRTLSHHNYVR